MTERGSQAILVAGGKGFIGAALCRRLIDAGYAVTVLTRNKRTNSGPLKYVTWAPQDEETASSLLAPILQDHAAVVNLAGESIVSVRWNNAGKRRILDSRLQATRVIIRAIELAERKPSLLINASAIGYYGPHANDAVTEASPAGADFLASVCRQWEEAALRAQSPGIRVVRLRIGIVLGLGGGALAKMLPPFKIGVGGPLGSGRQWMSWIHIDDLTAMILWLLRDPRATGPVNGVAPHPVTNKEFSKTLAGALHKPCFLKTPGFVLRLGLGEASTLLLEGQNVRPQVALNANFQFQYPNLEKALRNLVDQNGNRQ